MKSSTIIGITNFLLDSDKNACQRLMTNNNYQWLRSQLIGDPRLAHFLIQICPIHCCIIFHQKEICLKMTCIKSNHKWRWAIQTVFVGLKVVHLIIRMAKLINWKYMGLLIIILMTLKTMGQRISILTTLVMMEHLPKMERANNNILMVQNL